VARSLKKQFQARAVPAWAREGPLLYTDQAQLLFVPGLGIHASLWAAPGEPQWGLRWCPDGAQNDPGP
jgi:tRNA(Ile)-lysidine synthase